MVTNVKSKTKKSQFLYFFLFWTFLRTFV